MKALYLNKGIAIILFLLLLLCTYYREVLLVDINFLIEGNHLEKNTESVFNDFSILELTKWKWIVSIFFTVSISLLTIFILHIWFKDIDYTKFIVKIYFFVAIVVFLVSLSAYLLNSFIHIYPYMRRVLGIIHSPIPFFVFFLLNLAKKKENFRQPF